MIIRQSRCDRTQHRSHIVHIHPLSQKLVPTIQSHTLISYIFLFNILNTNSMVALENITSTSTSINHAIGQTWPHWIVEINNFTCLQNTEN